MASKQVFLSLSARNAVAAAFCNAFDTAENTGSVVTQVCNVAHKYLHGAPIEKDDADSVINMIAKQRGWKGPALKSRSSEVRTVLAAYHELPKAVSAYHEKASKCDWHTALRLARFLKRGESVKGAVTQAFNTQTQSAKSTPQGRTAGALKAWYKEARSDKREQILKAANLLGIKLGVKLDA